MDELNPLKKLSPAAQTMWIEASAGAGKTFAIEHLFVQMILEGKPIRNLLALSFTKKAAQQLRERILKNLQTCYEALGQAQSPFPYLSAYDPVEAKQYLEQALAQSSHCFIGTFHSYCSTLLTRYGTHGIEETEPLTFLEQTIERFVTEHPQLAQWPTDAWQKIVRFHCRGQTQTLIDALIQSALDAPGAAPHIDWPEIAAPIEKESIAHLLAQTKAIRKKPIDALYSALDALHRKQVPDDNAMDALLWACKTLHPDKLKKGHCVPHNLLTICATWHQWCETLQTLRKGHQKWHALLQLCHTVLADKIMQQGIISYDSLVKEASHLLENSALRKEILAHVDCGIVDEFQDTDPQQWSLLKKLFFGSESRPLIVVGDPKQAIYRFRKADIYTYCDAKEFFKKHYKLSYNYRSHPQLIAALNAMFHPKNVPNWIYLPQKKIAIHPPEIISAHNHPWNEPRCTFLAYTSTEHLWDTIATLLHRHTIALEEWAIIVRDHQQAMECFSALQKRGIHTKPYKIDPDACIFGWNILSLLITALKEDFGHASLWHCLALVHPIATVQALSDGTDPIQLSTLHTEWYTLRASMQKSSLAELYGRCCQTHYFNFDLLCLQHFGAAQLENLHMALLTLTSTTIPTNKLDQLANQWCLNPPAQKITPLYANYGPTIITNHAAKGLEFKNTILLSAGKRPTKGNEEHKEEEELHAEKARLFYVALTRAKEYIYIAVPPHTQCPIDSKQSPLEQWCAKLQGATPTATLQTTIADWVQRYPTLFSYTVCQYALQAHKEAPQQPLKQPLTYTFPPYHKLSFSKVFPSQRSKEQKNHDDPWPKGASMGLLWHRWMEHLARDGTFPHNNKLVDAAHTFGLQRYPWEDALIRQTKKLLSTPFAPFAFTLHDCTIEATETPFLFNTQQSTQWTGYIDAIGRYKNSWFVIDWKTNLLQNYTIDGAYQEALEHHYQEQAALYFHALQKGCALFEIDQFLGVWFIFLRGPVPLHFSPQTLLWKEPSTLY